MQPSFSRSGRLALAAACVLLTPVAATAAGTLSIVPASSELACNDERAVDVWIDAPVQDLQGFSLVLEFDPTVIEPTAVHVGQLLLDSLCGSFESWNNASTVGDSIFFDAAGLGCAVDGPGAIARIWFTGLADGITTLGIRTAILRDGANHPIEVDHVPAAMIVSCPVEADRMSWSTLKHAFH